MVNNNNSDNHYSGANLQPTNRDIALTRKRMGHIDAAVKHMGHFVADVQQRERLVLSALADGQRPDDLAMATIPFALRVRVRDSRSADLDACGSRLPLAQDSRCA